MIVKKYIVNLSDNFEEDNGDGGREIIKSLYFDHKPKGAEIRELMKKFRCKYVHIGVYFKKN